MLDRIDALRALAETGTMGKAAARLRITQSAVSKRISALEEETGDALVEPQGRRVRVTPAGMALLADVEPLVADLRERLAAGSKPRIHRIRVAASESLLGSWLPAALRSACDKNGITLEIHAHRGLFALERVRGGEVDVAIVPGGEDEVELRAVRLCAEPLAIVPSGTWDPQPGADIPVITVEAASLTGRQLDARLARRAKAWGFRLVPSERIESFSAAVQLARAGFGHALVPRPLAEALGATVVDLPEPGISRTICAVARPRVWERREIADLATALGK
jgi:DNA-binding transcriptional LysR family regulator